MLLPGFFISLPSCTHIHQPPPKTKPQMWPFTSSAPSDVKDEISPSLQTFFDAEDRSARSMNRESVDVPSKSVSRSEGQTLMDVEFAQFKQSTKKVAAINCAELQEAALECYKGWLYLTGTECSRKMVRSSKCMEVQQDALRRLRYEDCSSREQCVEIRMLADELFTRNFGQFGEKMDENTQRIFENDLQRTQKYLWLDTSSRGSDVGR